MRVSVRTEAVVRRDWTKGSIIGNLLSLSWPVIVTASLNMLGPTVDMIWVGKLGAASIAGVGAGGMAVMLVDSMKMGLVTGVRAMIARFIGAGDEQNAHEVARQAFVISAAYGIMVAIVGIALAEPILILLGLKADVVAQGAAYMRIMFLGRLAMAFRMLAETIMQASGDTMTPMKVMIYFRIFHVVLCPFLVFGWWLFPRMGVTGAATTNVISESLGTALGLWFLLSGRTRLRLIFRGFRFNLNLIWRMVKIGIPASIMTIERTFAQLVLMWFMVPFGTQAVAAHTLGQRVEMVVFMPSMGFGTAAGVLAGQNLGARQPGRAEKGGWLAASIVEGFMVACALAVLLKAEGVIHVFSSEPGLVELASTFLRIAAVSYLVMGINAVFSHCISGAGDTLPPMLVGLLNMYAVQVPLAFFLPQATNLGVYGVRWAMVAGTAVSSVVYVIYFRLGRWKRKRV